jgi:hypothetical protein
MSGFFPSDIASWALGGRNPDAQAEGENTTNNTTGDASSGNPLTDEDMRARRMARLAALENQSSTADSTDDNKEVDEAEPMEVDAPAKSSAAETKKSPRSNNTTTTPLSTSELISSYSLSSGPAFKKQAKALTPAEKQLRKKTQLLKKVLLLALDEEGTGVNLRLKLDNPAPCNLEGGDSLNGNWNTSHIAEILACRLSIEKSDARLDMARGGGGNDLVNYLCGCYRRAWGEWREVNGKVGKKSKGKEGDGEEDLLEILVEMRTQVSVEFMVCLAL